MRAGGSAVAATPPNGLRLAGGMPGESRRGLRRRHPRARERRSSTAVALSSPGAFHDAPGRALRGFSLYAGIPATRLLHLLRTVPAGPVGPASRTASDSRGVRVPGSAFRPHSIPPSQDLPDAPRGRSATALAAASEMSGTTWDNYIHQRHLGDFLSVDFPQEALSPLRA